MKIYGAKGDPTNKPDVRRAKWQLVIALVLATLVMSFLVKSCPENIRVKTTGTVLASV